MLSLDRSTLLSFVKTLVMLALVLATSSAGAQYTRDKAAAARIQEAINQRFLGGNFRSAEALLLGTIKACAGKCSPKLLARAWMYVGLVRSNSNSNPAGAEVAFSTALALDPGVGLDEDIATPDTKALFSKLAGNAAAPAPRPTPSAPQTPPGEPATPPASSPPAAAVSSLTPPPPMTCTPGAMSVQTRRPIPVSCQTEQNARSAELVYQEPGSSEWHRVTMAVAGGLIRGEIPCVSTDNAGRLRWYVIVKDVSGKLVDGFRSADDPVVMPLAEQVSEVPPSYPGQPAPERCAKNASVDCPPDFPGCEDKQDRTCGEKDYGVSCSSSSECKCGLLCSEGICERAPTCETDSDCPSDAHCVAGSCTAEYTPPVTYPTWWIGLSGGLDLAWARGNDLCTIEEQDSGNHTCFRAGGSERYPEGAERPYPGTGVKSTLARGKPRMLLSLDRALSATFLLGGRVGYAFGGAPDASFADALHVELRGTSYFRDDALSSSGLEPYIAFGAGYGQVDIKIEGRVFDCGPTPAASCYEGTGSPPIDNPLPVDVYAHYGDYFAQGSLGIVYLSRSNFGLAMELKLFLTFPRVTLGMHPSFGVVQGF